MVALPVWGAESVRKSRIEALKASFPAVRDSVSIAFSRSRLPAGFSGGRFASDYEQRCAECLGSNQ